MNKFYQKEPHVANETNETIRRWIEMKFKLGYYQSSVEVALVLARNYSRTQSNEQQQRSSNRKPTVLNRIMEFLSSNLIIFSHASTVI
jgi:hypothetical protein